MSDLRFLPNTGCYCGQTRLTLAQDCTQYTGVEWVDGEWQLGPETVEMTEAPDSVRLFCPDCGTYFHLPDNLPENI
jgi:hypothetical protein